MISNKTSNKTSFGLVGPLTKTLETTSLPARSDNRTQAKKGRPSTTSPMTTHPQGPPPWVMNSFMYPDELFCRDKHQIPMRSADQKKGRFLKTFLLAVLSRVRNEASFMYPGELFCRDRHRFPMRSKPKERSLRRESQRLCSAVLRNSLFSSHRYGSGLPAHWSDRQQ